MVKNAFADVRKANRGQTTSPARDFEIAVLEEYQAARQRGTAKAMEFFLARHPDSAYAEKARVDLRLLAQQPRL